MTAWFGKSWGAPACDEDEHVATPVGAPCERCKKPIEAEDQGVMMPLVSLDEFDEGSVSMIAYHLQCFLDGMFCPGCPRCKPEKFN
jgi:hypothetical protein